MNEVINPFNTAVAFWGQTNLIWCVFPRTGLGDYHMIFGVWCPITGRTTVVLEGLVFPPPKKEGAEAPKGRHTHIMGRSSTYACIRQLSQQPTGYANRHDGDRTCALERGDGHIITPRRRRTTPRRRRWEQQHAWHAPTRLTEISYQV